VKIIESGLPVVYLSKWHHDDEVVTVARDEFGGAYMATNHLLELGRKRIVHISGPLDYQVSIDRLEGYKQALQDHKILFNPQFVIEKDFMMESGYETAFQLQQLKLDYDAIFAGNDLMTLGVMKGLQEQGIKVPEDVAIVGYDDIEMAQLTNPALTTIHQSMRQIGMISAEKMIAMLNKQNVEDKQTIVPTNLIIRQSCGVHLT
jgi:DNA-binding LacI/PurR family transcriptional regulator